MACRELRGMDYFFDICYLHKNIYKYILRFLFMKKKSLFFVYTHIHTHLTRLTGLRSLVRRRPFTIYLCEKSCGALIIVYIHLHLFSLNSVTKTSPCFLSGFNAQIIFH